MIALTSKLLCDPHDVTPNLTTLRHSDSGLWQTPTVEYIVAPLKEAITSYMLYIQA